MSDNHIRGLSMAPDGRLAIRTASILNLYNGATFEHFYYDKSKDYQWDYWGLPKEYYDAENRIWMKERDYLLLLDLKTNRFIYDIEHELASIGITRKLINLFIDDSKNIWTIEDDKTFSYYDISEKKHVVVTEGSDSDFIDKYGIPKEIAQYKNICWIVYTSGLIRCWDYTSKEFIFQDTRFLDVINEATDRVYLHATPTGDLWLMYNYAIHFYNRTESKWTKVATISGSSNFFTCMDMDMDGNLWVGTSWSGLRFINKDTFEVEVIPGMDLDKGGTIVNDIYAIYADKDNGIWVGTLFQGLCYYQPDMRLFSLGHTIRNGTSITNETVRCFIEDKDGTIIIGTAKGLFRFNPENRKVERIYQELADQLCMSLYRDRKNRLWVSTFIGGFYCIDGNSIKNYRKYNKEEDLIYNTSRDIYEDPSGRYWVSVIGGVGEFFPETGEISMLYEKHPKVAFHKLNFKIYPIDDASFAAIGESGIYYYNTVTDSLWIPEVDSPDNPKFPNFSMKYYCTYQDSRTLEWFGTEEGVRIWDNKNNRLYRLSVEDGLPNNTISAILEDGNGVMWVASVSGISQIGVKSNPSGCEFSIANYGVSDGLQSGKFYDRADLRAGNGFIYFGGVHGFNYFDPQRMKNNNTAQTPIFDSFSLFNTTIKEGTKYKKRVILDKPINQTHEIILNHNENFITLEFAGLNYINPAHTYFKYMLEKFDKEWTEIVTEGSGKITYTALRPGTYNLKVYSSSNGKNWGDIPAELSIVIKPPFWATGYAIALYGILLLGSLFYLVVFINNRNKKKMEVQQRINQQKQKEELDQMKFRFFTNVSHEFRTPLTLILMPLEAIIKEATDVVLKDKLNSIYANAKNMLTLVNQMLDFRKLEMKGETLKLKQVNIKHFLQNIYMQFKESVTARNIDFIIDFETYMDDVYLDESKMHKVINNLLSNALKHTPDGGSIIIVAKTMIREDEKEYLEISVSDTGKGVTSGDKDKIFDRFYQSDTGKEELSGTGIGLHLVKEYIQMHQGEITVENKKEQGAKFTIRIPVDLHENVDYVVSSVAQPEKEIHKEENSTAMSEDQHKKTLLIVEDNAEFRSYLVGQLQSMFNIIEAPDGEVGEETALMKLPDLIISDIMMPKVDGITLCKHLKENIQTSHIPFILLTARSSDEIKVEGYDAGADSYISKPFSLEVLLTRIKKLIEQQEHRKELFHKTITVTPSSITITSLDEELVKKALKYVEANIDNTDYSVEDLSQDLGLHRSHLYRKIQSITGQTPLDFIRSIRLKRAAQYLINSQYNISEIADLVGFSTLKYFNKYFKEEFEMTPTQFRTKNKDV